MDSYHPTESVISAALANSGLGKTEWFLALRAISQKPLNFFLDEGKDLFKKHDTKYGLDESTKYLSSDYRSLYNLVTLSEKWNAATHLFKAFVISFFVRALVFAGYFKGSVSDNDQAIIGVNFIGP